MASVNIKEGEGHALGEGEDFWENFGKLFVYVKKNKEDIEKIYEDFKQNLRIFGWMLKKFRHFAENLKNNR